MDGKKAIGIEFQKKEEFYRFCKQRNRLCSGAFLPMILMRSGIGDTSELSNLGIKTLCTFEGVGKNLQDHIASHNLNQLNQTLQIGI